jgi:hypothetical protein
MIKEQRKKAMGHVTLLEARTKKLDFADEKLAILIASTLE